LEGFSGSASATVDDASRSSSKAGSNPTKQTLALSVAAGQMRTVATSVANEQVPPSLSVARSLLQQAIGEYVTGFQDDATAWANNDHAAGVRADGEIKQASTLLDSANKALSSNPCAVGG